MELLNGLQASNPEWTELRKSPYFETDFRRALDGEKEGICELAIYGKFRAQIIRDLWKIGVPMRLLREDIIREWHVASIGLVDAFGDDLDIFLRDAVGASIRLQEEFEVWRGGEEPFEAMAHGRSWTRSYSVACAFALNCRLWRDARSERFARAEGRPEPLVLIRRIRRDQVLAWLGGPERELVLAKDAVETPTQVCGSLPDWRRHRSRSRTQLFWA
jgi:hypothetical protein